MQATTRPRTPGAPRPTAPSRWPPTPSPSRSSATRTARWRCRGQRRPVRPDAWTPDAWTPDAWTPDAWTPDAWTPDVGRPLDGLDRRPTAGPGCGQGNDQRGRRPDILAPATPAWAARPHPGHSAWGSSATQDGPAVTAPVLEALTAAATDSCLAPPRDEAAPRRTALLKRIGSKVERLGGGHPVHSDEWPRLACSRQWSVLVGLSVLSGAVQVRASQDSVGQRKEALGISGQFWRCMWTRCSDDASGPRPDPLEEAPGGLGAGCRGCRGWRPRPGGQGQGLPR
jgi:hypothetical protein